MASVKRQQNQQQQNQGQYQQYQNQGQGGQQQQYKQPTFSSKVVRAAKDLGVTNMVMDVGASTLKRYAFAKVDEALMSPAEKTLRQYNTQLKTLVAKNNLTTAKIDNRALNESYKGWTDDSFNYQGHQQKWRNARGGTNYVSDYQRYNSDSQKKKDNR